MEFKELTKGVKVRILEPRYGYATGETVEVYEFPCKWPDMKWVYVRNERQDYSGPFEEHQIEIISPAAPEARSENPVLQHGDWKAGDIAFDRNGHEMRLICWERNSCGHEAWHVEDNDGSGTWCHEFEKNLKRRDESLYALDGLTPTDRRLRDERVRRIQQERIAANEHKAKLLKLSRIERALSEVGELRGYGADYMALTGCKRIEE